MERFKHAHLWLLIPFGIVMLGFTPSYWLVFTDAPWRQHLHGLTATAWFVFLVAQPWLATRGRIRQHRFVGMIGLVLAGGVVLSALGALPYNIQSETMGETARYALTFIDVVIIAGFGFAVGMAIKTASNVEDHARWMISTVFWALFPGLFRLSFLPLGMVFGGNIPFRQSTIIAGLGLFNIAALAILMLRDRRAHPAYLMVMIASVVFFIPLQVSRMTWWRQLADALFTI